MTVNTIHPVTMRCSWLPNVPAIAAMAARPNVV
ncbi:hypothetical protein ABIE21_000674 [Conyzicola nivalis]|uniref:Uncharacterized protein n=1 Tax=Conyzicola nivalis TaxID=1477021 RepID=A0ABV2QJG1_9MICO